jgi:hypothetical protein
MGSPRQAHSDLTLDDIWRRGEMQSRMNYTLKFRRLLWTEDGYLEVGPVAAQVSDKACICFSGQVLYILRSKEDRSYEFIGEVYIHGLMDGEVFKNPCLVEKIELLELS